MALGRVSLPPQLVEAAKAYAEGAQQPAEPRNAATVVLLRDARPGPEVYLMQRQSSMAFAGGMAVFPGGGVDPRDEAAAWVDGSWAGPTPAEWARRLGTDVPLARALVCAAVRETFEETGVLLAGPSPREVVSDTTGDDWEVDRIACESKELSLSDLLSRRGLVLRSDLLGPWSGWLTPVFEPRRYRTWFFVAALPDGQRARDVSTEASATRWVAARRGVELSEAGDLLMLPPTWMTCLDIAQHTRVDTVLADAHARNVEMFTPTAEPIYAEDGQVPEPVDWQLTVPPRFAELIAEWGRG